MLTEGSMLHTKISMQKLKGREKISDLAMLRRLQRGQQQGKNRETTTKKIYRTQGD